jgi:hypothetical protein
MVNQLTRERTVDEVRNTLLAIKSALSSVGELQTCVLHCMQPRRLNFYQGLEIDFGVRIVPCHPRKGLKSVLFKGMLGYAALIVPRDYNELPSLFARIGEQAIAGLYVISNSMLESAELAQLGNSEIATAVKQSPAHLFYQVDEDSAVEDGLVTELVSVGPICPKMLAEAVGLGLPLSI